jgi:glycerol uptake facilitator-like aquaporin
MTAYTNALSRRLAAEGLGSLLLTATVVGSGIMAERLSGGNVAIALLANTAATVAVLAALIALLGAVSGAHFNPAVSVIEALRGRLAWRDAGTYTFVQIIGCCAGALTAHMMFELSVWQFSAHVRTGPAQWLAEVVATFGLLLIVLGHQSRHHDRALLDEYLRRDTACRCAGLHRGAVRWRAGGPGCCKSAVSGQSTDPDPTCFSSYCWNSHNPRGRGLND